VLQHYLLSSFEKMVVLLDYARAIRSARSWLSWLKWNWFVSRSLEQIL
jgi:hypothetical protein